MMFTRQRGLIELVLEISMIASENARERIH